MKEGTRYIDEYGQWWILRDWYGVWMVWREETGWGVWDYGRGLTDERTYNLIHSQS